MHQFNKVILAAIFILSGCSKSPDTSSDTPPVGVMVSEVTLSSRSESYQFIGQAKAAEQVILRARVKAYCKRVLLKKEVKLKKMICYIKLNLINIKWLTIKRQPNKQKLKPV